MPFLYVFRVENVPFEVLDFFYLLLSNFFASSKLVLVRFEHPHCMIFEFSRVAHTVLEQHGFFVDKIDLVLNFVIFLLHQLEKVFESGDFFVFLASFGFGLDLESVFFLENHVNLNCASLLSQ